MPEAWFALWAGVAWKSSLMLVLARIVAIGLRRRSAAARHLVWTAAAAATLGLPVLSIWLPTLSVPAPAILSENFVFRMTALAHVDRGAGSPASQAGASVADTGAAGKWRSDWRALSLLVWAAGAFFACSQMAIGFAGIRRLRRVASASPEQRLAEELARSLGIRRGVEVLETRPGSMPMTFGLLRPAIFMPRDAVEWSEERRRIVLLHELAHVHRGDVATQLVARLAWILNWWNPLAWAAWREFLKERERATDDLVLQAGARASDYASHLLQVAWAVQGNAAPAWAHVAMARKSQLEARLAAILDAHANRNSAGRISALAAAAMAVIVAAPLAAVRPQETRIDYGLGLMKLAEREQQRNRRREAEAFYAKAAAVLGERREAAPALLSLGQSAIRRKDFAQAVAYFEGARRFDPARAAEARMWTGVVRETQRNFAEAESMYKSALAAAQGEPAKTTIQQMYGLFLRRQGRDQEAQALLARAARAGRQAHMAPAAAGVFRVGGAVQPPSLLSKTEPEYSEEARLAKFQGTVVLQIEVGTDGWAHNVRVTRSLGLGLDEKAVAAIGRWRFRPGMKDGVAVPVAANVEVNFRLL